MALAATVTLLLFCMQVSFLALERSASPAEVLAWYPEATVDESELRSARGRQARDMALTRRYWNIAGSAYELGLLSFLTALLLLLAPPSDAWDGPRGAAFALAAVALVVELWWSVARLTNHKIPHPIVKRPDPAEADSPSAVGLAATLDPGRTSAAGLPYLDGARPAPVPARKS